MGEGSMRQVAEKMIERRAKDKVRKEWSSKGRERYASAMERKGEDVGGVDGVGRGGTDPEKKRGDLREELRRLFNEE